MKLNRNTYFFLLQLLLLILFFSLTLLNEEFDLPFHLLGDPPSPPQHRHGEMMLEFIFFFLVVLVYYFFNKSLLKKIQHYEQQKEMFERTFYHDIHNTALTLHGLVSRLHKIEKEKINTYKKVIYHTSRQLLEEIESQRDISHAERNELAIHPQQLHSIEILSEVLDQYKNISIARNKKITIDPDSRDLILTSDRTIIKRVLGNMIKNALEATQADQTVTIGCRAVQNKVEFYVHNPTFMPSNIQHSVFTYSFSTKGKGRGLGTYSMKLLGERYLNGKITFQTSEEHGTTFKASFPVHIDDPDTSQSGQ